MSDKQPFYDPGLRDRLPATSDHPVVLNDRFMDWEEQIAGSLKPRRTTETSRRYGNPKEQELLRACQEHAAEHSRPTSARSLVGLVHPLYLQLSHMDCLTDSTRPEVKEYLDRLTGFLESCRAREDVGLVLIESLPHYAAASSLLLEEGLVDQVVFTERDRGKLLYKEDMEFFIDRQLFVAGGYNERCFSKFAGDANRAFAEEGSGELLVIKDLVLDSPRDKYYSILDPSPIYFHKDISLSTQHVPADQVLERFELSTSEV